MVTEPSAVVLHEASVDEMVPVRGSAGWPTKMPSTSLVQPAASPICTLYEPEGMPVRFCTVAPLLHWNVYGGVPDRTPM